MPSKRVAKAAPEGPVRQSTRPRRAPEREDYDEESPEEQEEDDEEFQIGAGVVQRPAGTRPAAAAAAAAVPEQDDDNAVADAKLSDLGSTIKYLNDIKALKLDIAVGATPQPLSHPPVSHVSQELDPSAVTPESNIRSVRNSGVAFLVDELGKKGWHAVCALVLFLTLCPWFLTHWAGCHHPSDGPH